MASSLLQSIEAKEQIEKILVAINDAFPGKKQIQDELSKYSQSKDTFIKQLQEMWHQREMSVFTELQIRQMNSTYYSDKARKQVSSKLHGQDLVEMPSRDWVIKTETAWKGWNASESNYYETPILFEGDIGYEKNFAPLVVCDPASKSVNLIISLEKIIRRGSSMCLSDGNWSTLFLTFAKNHMANDHQSLSQYSDNADTLFEEIVKSVNAESEIAKIRTSLANISRKPGESIQTPLYRLKTLYEMLISISLPTLDPEIIKIRADHYGCNVAKHLVSANTAKIIADYVVIRQQRDEKINLMKLCNVITTHEAGTPGDRIQTVQNLPSSASRLDSTISAASNVEELLVAASAFPVNSSQNQPPRRNSQSYSPRFRRSQSKSPYRQSRSPNRQSNNNNWRRGKNGTAYSPGGSKMYRRSSSGNHDRNDGRRSSGNRQKSLRREGSPRYRGNTPTRNQYGSGYSRNPSGNRSRNSQGRSPSKSERERCERCNSSAHASEYCDIYGYSPRGTSCETCGLRHFTRYHRQRSSSGRRDQPRRVVRNHQVVLEDQTSGGQKPPEEQVPPRFHSSKFENIFGGKN